MSTSKLTTLGYKTSNVSPSIFIKQVVKVRLHAENT